MAYSRLTRNQLWTAAALGLLTLLAYANSFSTGFTFDSLIVITKDPRILQATGANLQQILNQDYWWPNFHSGLYRPLSTLTFLLNYAVLANGTDPAGYHAVNLLFHLVNVWLLFLLASRLLGNAYTAFFAAALWAVHPIGTEAVTNLVGRSDELAAMSILGALLLYQRAVQWHGRRLAGAAASLFVIAVLGGTAKEFAAVLIAMLLLWDLAQGKEGPLAWLRLRWPFYLAATLGLCVFLGLRWRVLHTQPPMQLPFLDNPLAYASFWEAKLTALKVICLDLWLLIWPVSLSADRSYNQISIVGWGSAAAWAALLLVGGLLAVAILRRRKDPVIFWCVGFCAIALLPTSNLVVPIGSIMAERFLYLPSAAFAVAVTALVFRSQWRGHAPAILGTLVALYAVRTYARNADWKDDLTLFSHDVTVAPASFKTHDHLASQFFAQGPANLDSAIHEEEMAWNIIRSLAPQRVLPQVPANLGLYYRQKGYLSGGATSAEGRPWYSKSLAILLEAQRDSLANGDAYDHLQRGQGNTLSARVERPDVYLNLGVTEHALGMYPQAREAYLYGRTLSPNDAQLYNALAENYASEGNLVWAVITLEEKMLEAQPEQETLAVLQGFFAKLPGGDCALVQEGGGLRLNTSCPAVHLCMVWSDLGQMYRQGRRPDEAAEIKRNAMAQGCPAAGFERGSQ